MSPQLSVILLARGPDRLVRRAAESLAAQTLTGIEVVVVHDRRTEASARRRLAALGLDAPAAFVAAPDLGAGAARNAGVRASRGRCFAIVDGGEALEPGYFQAACVALEHDSEAAFATSRPAHAPATSTPSPEAGGPVEIADLLESPWAAAAATVVRRAAWDASGGFDETLPDLADWELSLRVAGRGGRGLWLAPGLAARFERDDVLLRHALRPERYLPSIRRILEKHAAAFGHDAGRALSGRERNAKAIWERERDLIGRQNAARAELARLTGELQVLRAELARRGRDASVWDDLRRTTPVSRNWGLDRGRPIDRHYIEGFVAAHAADIRGSVLEVLDDGLTRRFGGDRVERSDVLDIDVDNRRATVLADLRDAHPIAGDTYDCFILTQTLHVIDDIGAAIAEAHRVLKPGGVLLATLPSLSMLAPDGGPGSDFWRVTEAGARTLFEKVFPPAALEVRSRGNVLAATAFLQGLSCEEVETRELDADDPDYPVLVTVRAVKEGRPAHRSEPRRAAKAAILLYHRVASPTHDAHGLAVPASTFRSQLASLARGWEIVPLPALARACASGSPPDRSLALTFDDGYLDNLENVLPVLEEFGVPATFFLTAERPGAELRFWWDVLEQVLLAKPALPSRLELRIDGQPRGFAAGNPEERRASHDELHGILKASVPAVRDDLLRQLAAATGDPRAARPAARRMVEQEIRVLAASPRIEVGAHGLHHLSLPSLSRDDLHREIFECRSVLERITARRITSFAYPFGDVSPASADMVVAAGFRWAVTCEARLLRERERPHLLPRLEAGGRSGEELTAWLDERRTD